MSKKFLNIILTSGLFFALSTVSAIAKTTVNLEEFKEPELELSLSKDIFKTSIPAIYNLTLNDTENPGASIPVTIKLTEPALAEGETPDPNGTKLKAYVSFTDSSGASKTLNSNDRTITAKLKSGITKLTLEMKADRPSEYFGGSYDYNFTLTVEPVAP